MDPHHHYTAGQDINFEYAPAVSVSTQKKRRKKKKKPPAAITMHADGQGVTINDITQAGLRGAASAAADNIWNVNAAEERMRVRAFWLSLTEAERIDLVRLDKEVLLEKVRKQRHPCGCSVCGRKRVAIEQELEALYKAYYAEIEAFGGRQHEMGLEPLQPPLPPQPAAVAPLPPSPSPPVVESHEEDSEYSDYYEQYDEIGGEILSVADDLLKNDGRQFVDVMEHLASQRIQREVPAHECTSEYDAEFPDDPPLDEEQLRLEDEQRLADGRRMLQIFAARMFEQRVLNAYREHVAKERQQQLLMEIEAEDQAQTIKDQKKQKDKEKKKDKKRQQRQQKEDAEKKKLEQIELQRQEKERIQQEKIRLQRLEEEKRKAEAHRLEIEARMRKLELEEKQQKVVKSPATPAKAPAKAPTAKVTPAKTTTTPTKVPPSAKPLNSKETMDKEAKVIKETKEKAPLPKSAPLDACDFKSPKPKSANGLSQGHRSGSTHVPPKGPSPFSTSREQSPAPINAPISQLLQPSPVSNQTIRPMSHKMPSFSGHTGSNMLAGSQVPKISSSITQRAGVQVSPHSIQAAQQAAQHGAQHIQAPPLMTMDRTNTWQRTPQPVSYRQEFPIVRPSAGSLYNWNQWAPPGSSTINAIPSPGAPSPAAASSVAAPVHSTTLPPAPATLWSQTSLWSNSTSLDAIRHAAIASCDRLTAEGLAVDGFVPSQVLFHATANALGGAQFSQNDLFHACDINSATSDEFECLRDRVGLVTHVRHVRP